VSDQGLVPPVAFVLRALARRIASFFELSQASWLEKSVLVFALLNASVGIWWGLPGHESWAADSISPRSIGLLALAETYRSGHHHIYPPLHTWLLTVLTFPIHLWTVAQAGTDSEAFTNTMIRPGSMTAIELVARAVCILMLTACVRLVMLLFGKNAQTRVLAGVSVVCIGPLAYYGKLGNLDVPSLFWALMSLHAIARSTSPREPCEQKRIMANRAWFFATGAVLTKDQAAGMLILPLLVALWMRRRELRSAAGLKSELGAIAAGCAIYALVSGALVNPRGYRDRLRELFGSASQDWAEYPNTLSGRLELLHGIAKAFPEHTSWPLSLATVVGLFLCILHTTRQFDSARRVSPDGTDANRLSDGLVAPSLLPLLAATSFTLTFSFGARRTEARFLLPHLALLVPYSSYALTLVRGTLLRRALAASCFGTAFIAVLSVHGTLLFDARYQAEGFLAGLPQGSHVVALGGPKFLPRFPGNVRASRHSGQTLMERSRMPKVTESLEVPTERPREPTWLVLAAELSHEAPAPTPSAKQTSYTDLAWQTFLFRLTHDHSAYQRIFRAQCTLPWPLRCVRWQGASTGEDIWIYRVEAEVKAP
jgi:hypothetical protein